MRGYLPCLMATTCLLLCNWTFAASAQKPTVAQRAPVTAVTGESWLNHLHRSFGDTSMGKTGRLGPPAPEPFQAQPAFTPALSFGDAGADVALRGSDLYRLSCRACHGEAGLGAPPEINSLVNPVRATSAPLVMQRMKSSGMAIGASAAAELAKESNAALLQRLHDGGENMPPFSYLSDAEVRALLGYMKELAGVPQSASAGAAVRAPAFRIGEHVVKSTCHICHDATGPNPTAQELEDGAIPPLSTLTARVDEAGFVRKVTSGAPIVMGTPITPHRGRMPVFYYITPQEAAAAYLYLASVPPAERNVPVTIAAMTGDNSSPRGAPPHAGRTITLSPSVQTGIRSQADDTPGVQPALVFGSLVAIVFALLLGGFLFSVREFRRLSAAATSGAPLSGMTMRPQFRLSTWPRNQDQQSKFLCSPQKSG